MNDPRKEFKDNGDWECLANCDKDKCICWDLQEGM